MRIESGLLNRLWLTGCSSCVAFRGADNEHRRASIAMVSVGLTIKTKQADSLANDAEHRIDCSEVAGHGSVPQCCLKPVQTGQFNCAELIDTVDQAFFERPRHGSVSTPPVSVPDSFSDLVIREPFRD
jgi:hypothetical protein